VVDASDVVVNRPAVEAGVEVFYAGGDFADGLFGYGGSWLSGESFVSFDKEAVSLLGKRVQDTKLVL
jgi:predicted nucleic-acid-binding protein